jgi:DNA-binding transcriptional LysR family regulator
MIVHPLTETDLKLLRIFRLVAESGGLTAAEERLGLEASTISRHLQRLESRLGAKLCTRGPAGFKLTEFGEEALNAARGANDLLDMLEQQLSLAKNMLSGDLHIGIADNCLSNPASRLADAIREFRVQAPKIVLHLSVNSPLELTKGLAESRYHLIISGIHGINFRVNKTRIFSEEHRVYTEDTGEDISLSSLKGRKYTFIYKINDPKSKSVADRLGVSRTAVSFGLEAVATMIISGNCVGFLPTHYAEMLSRSNKIREVSEAETCRYKTHGFLISAADRPLTPSANLLSRLIVQKCGPPASPAGIK